MPLQVELRSRVETIRGLFDLMAVFERTKKRAMGRGSVRRFDEAGLILDISQVAKRSGLPASTLRFYEEKRLITSIGRRGLRRVFESTVLERLALIALGRAAGFSLDEIALMFTAQGQAHIDRELLTAKADELDQTIEKLTAMRNGLRHAAICPAPRHDQCPSFRRLLRAAGMGLLSGVAKGK